MKKPRTVLFLDNSFTFGGAINSLAHLVNGLNRAEVTPIVISGQSEEVLASLFPNIEKHTLRPHLSWVDNRIFLRLTSYRIFRIDALLKVARLLRSVYWHVYLYPLDAFRYVKIAKGREIDIVHLNNIMGSQLAGVMAAKCLRVPCVAHLRDFQEVHPLVKLYAKLIDHHVAISTSIRENLKSLDIPDSKISLIHDAIDVQLFEKCRDEGRLSREFHLKGMQTKFGIFGRVIPWKGIEEFIRASKNVIDQVPNTVAFIVGAPSDGSKQFFSEMEALVSRLGLDDKVFFTGYRENVGQLMVEMDLVVHASISPEPFGMDMIEAMACGRAVVAPEVGGPMDIIVPGVTGLLFKSGCVKSLSEAIVELLNDSQRRESMGLAGHARVAEYFHMNRYAREVEAVYESMPSK